MNIKKITSTVLLISISLYGINTYEDTYVPTGEKLYNEIQNTVSRAVGKNFSNIPASDRKNIYKSIENELYRFSTTSSSFLKSEIERATAQVLAAHSGRLLEQYGKAQGLTSDQIKTLRTYYQKNICTTCNIHFNNCAQDIFDPIKMHAVTGDFIKKENSHSKFNQFIAGIAHLVELVTGSDTTTSSTPVEHKNNEPTPSISTTPSAPTYELVTNTFCSESCCVCMEDFGPNTPRYFLPCGHPLCAQDIQGWFFDQSKNTCPVCRASCSSVQKTELRNALNPQVRSCCRCNKVKNDCIRLSNCNHYVCFQCEYNWKNNANIFGQECPRCCIHI